MDAQTLSTLVYLATRDRDAAAARQAQLAQRAAQARDALNKLRGYAVEYEQRAHAQRHKGYDAATDANLRAFDQKMLTALDAQQQELNTRTAAVEAAAVEVNRCERRLQTLKKLIERRAQDAQRHEDKRDQKRNDEFAGRTALAALADAAERARGIQG